MDLESIYANDDLLINLTELESEAAMDRRKNQSRAARPTSSRTGFLLLDASFEPIYANDDAIQILTYPKGGRELRSLNGALSKKIQSLYSMATPLRNFHPPRRFYQAEGIIVAGLFRSNPTQQTRLTPPSSCSSGACGNLSMWRRWRRRFISPNASKRPSGS